MKKIVSLILSIMLLLQGFTYYIPVNASTNNTKLMYENISVPITKGNYVNNVFDVDADYFKIGSNLVIDTSDFEKAYSYKLRIYRVFDAINVLFECSGKTTDGKVIVDLGTSSTNLAPGEYIFQLEITNKLTTYTETLNIGYYYYNDLDAGIAYKDGTHVAPISPIQKNPDSAVSEVMLSRNRIMIDKDIQINLSNMHNFDPNTTYTYMVEYVILEPNNILGGTLLKENTFTQDKDMILVIPNIDTSISLALEKYSIVIHITDDKDSTTAFTAQIDCKLYDFKLTNGSLKLDTGVTPIYTRDQVNNSYSEFLIDMNNFTKDKTYYLLTSGYGLDKNANYEYKLTFKDKGQVTTSTSYQNVVGKTLLDGVPFTRSLANDLPFDEIVLTVKAGAAFESYRYLFSNFALNNSLFIVDSIRQAILVKEGTKATDIKNSSQFTSQIGTQFSINIDSTISGDTVVTGSNLTINLNGQSILTYQIAVIGDNSGDGKVTMSDVIRLRKHLADIDLLTGINLTASDVNKDSNVTMSDVIRLRKHLAGIESL
ncbi:MAG: dockerin type I repeat-containing protein [Bacilli bacterium]